MNSEGFKTLDVFWEKIENIKTEIEKQNKTKQVYLKQLEEEENEIQKEIITKKEKKQKTNAIKELKRMLEEQYRDVSQEKVFLNINKSHENQANVVADNEDLYLMERIENDLKKKDGFLVDKFND